MTAAISVRDLFFQYPRSAFYLDIEFLTFHPGRVYVIHGKNGSGKTTLSKLLCGILRSEEGEIALFGKDLRHMNLGQIGEHVGYLFQEPAMQLFTATVKEEMTFVSDFRGENRENVKKRAEELLGRFQLEHLKERSVYRLSRGEKQRLALCAILMSGLRFLILDEPTTGLDEKNRKILYDMVDQLSREGIGVAIVSHSKELLRRYGERGVHVEGGKAVQYGPAG